MTSNTSDGWPEPHPKAKEANQRFIHLTGSIVREFAHLELYLADCLAALLKTDSWRARIVFAKMPNIRARRKLLAALSETYLDDPEKSEFNAVLNALKHLANKRNMLAHHYGGLDADDPRYVHLLTDSDDEAPTKGMAFGTRKKVQLSTLRNWTREISALRKSLESWPQRLSNAHKLPRLHRELRAQDQSQSSGPPDPTPRP